MDNLKLRSGEKSANGENISKEAALNKLHQLEWMRNKQDSWHSARSNSASQHLHEKKKKNKDEDVYFEGTASTKTKKSRRPRPAQSSSGPIIPAGCSVAKSPSFPPRVNAWAQKKGSALFNKSEEMDDEKITLELVIEESMKTADEEERRRRQSERSMVINMKETTPPFERKECSELESDDDLDRNKCSKSSTIVKKSHTEDLHFIDSDYGDEPVVYSQRRNPVPARNKKTPLLIKTTTDAPLLSNENNNSPELPPSCDEKFVQSPGVNTTNNCPLESHHHKKISNPQFQNNIDDEIAQLSVSYRNRAPESNFNRAITIPKNADNIVPLVNDLTTNVASTLIFGDTADLLKDIHNENLYKSLAESKSYTKDLSAYQSDESNNSDGEPAQRFSSSIDPASYSDTSETDIMIHKFLRHDPPSPITVNTSTTQVIGGSANNYVFENTHFDQNQYLLHNGSNSQLSVVNSIEQDSSSSMSDSPLQNTTPYGSFETQISPGLARNSQMPAQNTHYPLTYVVGIQGNHECNKNLHGFHPTNQDQPSQMAFSHIPPGYLTLNQGFVPLNSPLNQISGLHQYSLPNPNLIIHPQNLHTMQHYHAQMQQKAINGIQQYPPAHISVSNVSNGVESIENKKEQVNNEIIQTQMLSLHNQQQIIPGTIPTLNQQQMSPMLKPGLITNEYDKEIGSNKQVEQGITQSGKTKEEIYLECQEAFQKYAQLQQLLAESLIQTQSIQIPQQHPHLLQIPQQSHHTQLQIPQQTHPMQVPLQTHPLQIQQQTSPIQVEQQTHPIQVPRKTNPIKIPQHHPGQIPQPEYGLPTHPIAMGINNFYSSIPVLNHIQQEQQFNQMENAGQLSPNYGPVDMSSELSEAQTKIEPKIGRGRGRLH